MPRYLQHCKELIRKHQLEDYLNVCQARRKAMPPGNRHVLTGVLFCMSFMLLRRPACGPAPRAGLAQARRPGRLCPGPLQEEVPPRGPRQTQAQVPHGRRFRNSDLREGLLRLCSKSTDSRSKRTGTQRRMAPQPVSHDRGVLSGRTTGPPPSPNQYRATGFEIRDPKSEADGHWKFEIRSTKSETNPKSKTPMTQTPCRPRPVSNFGPLNIRICFGFPERHRATGVHLRRSCRISCFEFEISIRQVGLGDPFHVPAII